MLELPEAITIAGQINRTLYGKSISNVIAAHSPHKFAWYHGDPDQYHNLLTGKTIGSARGVPASWVTSVPVPVVLEPRCCHPPTGAVRL